MKRKAQCGYQVVIKLYRSLSSPLKPSSGELAAMAAALTGGDGECAGGQSMGVK